MSNPNAVGGVPTFGQPSPMGDPAPSNHLGVWLDSGTRWFNEPFWKYSYLVDANNPLIVSTPAASPSASADGPAQCPPVQFSSPGKGNTPPNAGQPLKVVGNPSSTGNPDIDGNRRVSGTVVGVTFGN